LKKPFIFAIAGAGALAVAAVAVVLVVSAGKQDDATRIAPDHQAAVSASAPSAAHTAHPLKPGARRGMSFPASPGGRNLVVPPPIRRQDYVRNTVMNRVRSRAATQPTTAPTVSTVGGSGPTPVETTLDKARQLRREGRAADADRMLKDALMTETNPYNRNMLTTEIEAGAAADKAPARPGTRFQH